jgi:hypothetical protein
MKQEIAQVQMKLVPVVSTPEPADRVPGAPHLAERRLAEQRLAEQRLAEQRLAEQRLAEQRLADKREREALMPWGVKAAA